MKFHISIMYYLCLYKLHGCWKHLVNQEILKVQKPLSIMDLYCQYVVWPRYKIACELIKFSTGNLPSSAFTPIFEEVFFVPRRCLQKIK